MSEYLEGGREAMTAASLPGTDPLQVVRGSTAASSMLHTCSNTHATHRWTAVTLSRSFRLGAMMRFSGSEGREDDGMLE